MTMDDWVRIARDINHYYERYDGFLILHGTDTMAYTASALSFMLENLGKPVVLTGSQVPMFELRSDGWNNFLGALLIAGGVCAIPEVTVFFHDRVSHVCVCVTDTLLLTRDDVGLLLVDVAVQSWSLPTLQEQNSPCFLENLSTECDINPIVFNSGYF